jgi:tetratricopeptide (TPR) repeat protein/peroxiredoxin
VSRDDEVKSKADDPDLGLARMMSEGRSFSGRERNVCFLNTGASAEASGRFANVSAVSGLDFEDDGRAVALVDWDHDGDQDLWISNRNAPRLRLMRNNLPRGSHFLQLRLQGNGTTSNRDGIGARVEVVAESERSVKTLRAGEGFLAQSSKWLHFGLGSTEEIEKVTVRWPDGAVEEFAGVAVDHRYRIVQGSGKATMATGLERNVTLDAARQKVAPATQATRIPMVEWVRVPTLEYESIGGEARRLTTGDGKWRLVNLWSRSCAPCLTELSEFSKRHNEMRAAGIDILALSVDGLGSDDSERIKAADYASNRRFWFSTGLATESLLRDLQFLNDIRFALHRRLPLPCSFLIDPQGRLAVMYKGPVSVDQVVADATLSEGSRLERWRRAGPLGGTALPHPVIERQASNWGATLRLLLAEALREEGRYEDEAAQYADVLAIKPGSAQTRFNLGTALRNLGRLEEAASHFREALRLNPEFAEAHSNLASVLLNLGRFDEAEANYQAALRIKPNMPGVEYNLANALQKSGQISESLSHYAEAVRLDPTFAQAYFNMGNVLARLQRLAEAAESYRHAVRIKPDYANAHLNLGSVLRAGGRLEEAIVSYRNGLKHNPGFAQGHFNLGTALQEVGQHDEARFHLQEAQRLAEEGRQGEE